MNFLNTEIGFFFLDGSKIKELDFLSEKFINPLINEKYEGNLVYDNYLSNYIDYPALQTTKNHFIEAIQLIKEYNESGGYIENVTRFSMFKHCIYPLFDNWSHDTPFLFLPFDDMQKLLSNNIFSQLINKGLKESIEGIFPDSEYSHHKYHKFTKEEACQISHLFEKFQIPSLITKYVKKGCETKSLDFYVAYQN